MFFLTIILTNKEILYFFGKHKRGHNKKIEYDRFFEKGFAFEPMLYKFLSDFSRRNRGWRAFGGTEHKHTAL